jgi:hypothetical protein
LTEGDLTAIWIWLTENIAVCPFRRENMRVRLFYVELHVDYVEFRALPRKKMSLCPVICDAVAKSTAPPQSVA